MSDPQFTNPNPQFYLDAGFIYNMVDDLSGIFVKVLQGFFQSHPLTKDFRFTSNQDPAGKLRIAEEYQIDERFFPCIIVSSVPMTGTPWSLGDNLGLVNDTSNGKSYLRKGGMILATIQISAMALGIRECKRIADMVGLGLCYPLQRELAGNNIVMVPNSFRVSAVSERAIGPSSIKAYQIDLGQQIQTSWVQDFELTADELEGLKITPNIPKEGGSVVRERGVITTATLSTITDSTKSWPENAFRTYQLVLKKPGDELASYTLDIVSNNSNTLNFSPALTEVPMASWEYSIVSKREQIDT